MHKLKAFFLIIRPSNFFITFFAVIIAGKISSLNNQFEYSLIYAAFSMALACSAGNIINDIYDVEIDKFNKPKRVLPNKLLTITAAKGFYIILVLASLILAGTNGLNSFLFMIMVNTIIFLYSAVLKKLLFISNITVAALTSSALLYGAMLAENILAGLIPAVFAFLLNFIREIVKDMEDIKGDLYAGIITFASKYGDRTSKKLIIVVSAVFFILTFIPFAYRIYKIEYFVIVMIFVNTLLFYSIKLLLNDSAHKNLSKISMLLKICMVMGIIAIYAGT
ncbi:MAG: geranylgeranylglycerol-phosphate geranylgeranyltransferase [Ignavibacteriaceae bacterium]|nr:geranylgeranylglycerol-phosphate geranylgeranyltransferase [Ignavibacteriaceae bacterium]